ncbi:thymidylate synthase [Geobacillus stearothermophilus]|uniref:thymidylate synthase n=1 Tax=Geobacillus stearothermophilus TaxID=1422 RepID=UPI002E1EDD17|nr:thymidylate synthase [Geobacillus stearothermophilus]MED4357810.1 thymidylate synthase [Geobacillus stearothermophilus]
MPFAVAEWLWCMKGANDLEMISYYAPSYRKYSDNGITLHGAYGPRIQKYLPKIINLLQKDEHSRRAVIPIYTIHDVAIESKDIPCTSSIQFLIRNGRLNLIVHMRSNDIYLGLPYDVFNFTMLQEYVARKLNVQIGTYTHIVNSLHYYKKNEETIKRIAYSAPAKAKEMPLMPKDDLDNRLQELIKYEEELRINGNKIKVPNEGYFGNLAFILYKYSKDREMSTHDSSSSILHSSFK